ncbi:CLUMA_CG000011, isoform A [Clunio marinus]|uniref:CLUMA_CG000011, isoform A n=1 Tax=Clunio marinus TaxID=568069 RepID=A0A1J1HF52_9DIPT|nr:CLUMA_CG000011, isoform A [Clunio marinus]
MEEKKQNLKRQIEEKTELQNILSKQLKEIATKYFDLLKENEEKELSMTYKNKDRELYHQLLTKEAAKLLERENASINQNSFETLDNTDNMDTFDFSSRYENLIGMLKHCRENFSEEAIATKTEKVKKDIEEVFAKSIRQKQLNEEMKQELLEGNDNSNAVTLAMKKKELEMISNKEKSTKTRIRTLKTRLDHIKSKIEKKEKGNLLNSAIELPPLEPEQYFSQPIEEDAEHTAKQTKDPKTQ